MFCRKNKVRVISFFLLIVVISSCMFMETLAYTYTGKSDYRTISPSKSQFKSAKSPRYSSNYQTISNCSISEKYDVNLHHYEAPMEGYYKVYSTGSTDTVGTIFEEENFLFFTTDYERITKVSDDDGEKLNFKLVTYFDYEEDYYIGVRCYGQKTGKYNLKIEPNDDLVYSNYGGVWYNNNSDDIGTRKKEYLNPAQVKEYYQMLRDELTVKSIKNAYKRYGTTGTLQRLSSAGLTAFSIVDIAFSVAKIPGAGNPLVGGLVMIGEAALSAVFDSCYYNTDQIAYVMDRLATLCGAGYIKQKGKDVYKDPYCGILITSGLQQTYVKNGFGQKFIKYIPFELYSSFSGNKMTGVSYKKGTWR